MRKLAGSTRHSCTGQGGHRQLGLKAGQVNQIGAAAGAGSQGSLKAGRVNQVGAACWCSQAGWLEGRPEQPGW